ncbi:pentatricopeptide repeat-containing protein At5g66520-like [Cynara cardunculus var. scolymus]|uniref:pentatricopeptide repeat-containing protein At5g66520-like n=1 Tax=Cynara cardunculus var. scolymus TaxID=59895 RepID=UPI000D62DD17|nr:pentatricopeptide repeat-containing protein At5g66520-like [Cynara cardunculus var. scolymus]
MLVQEAFPAITPKTHRTSRFLQQFLFNIFQSANTVRKTTQIHTQIIINAFTQRNFIIVKLLQSYVSSGYLHQAHQVFEQINNPSTTSWNQIIRGYAWTDTPRESIHYFDEMLASGEIPDEYTYCYVMSACARGKLLRLGEKFHGRVLAGGFCSNLYLQTNLVNLYAVVGEGNYGGIKNAHKVFDEMTERNVVTWNTLLAGYVKCRDIDGACRVFDVMPERNIVSWTTLVSGFAHNGGCKEALSLLRKMLQARMEFDQAILVAALSACAEIGDLKMGRWIHSYIHRSWHMKNEEHTVCLNNALLHMYAGCGLIDDAYELFKRMPIRTTVSWTTMISSFAKQGRGKDALSLFQSMENAKDDSPKPDAITILAVLNACSHSGFVEQGRRVFKNMNLIWGIKPKIEHYGCMVDLLSRAGLLDEALTLLESMPMDPNDTIWGALLGGCRIHKNVKLASLIAQKIANLNLEDDKVAGYLVLLSNIYAGAKKWKEVANAREKMVQLEVRKPPGRSWVQIGGSVHEFLAGDTIHKRTSLIYKMLLLVTIEAGLSGYEPDVYEAAAQT